MRQLGSNATSTDYADYTDLKCYTLQAEKSVQSA